MNRRRYSEDQFVQKLAAQLLAGMAWGSVVAFMRTEIFDYLFDQLPEGAYGQDEILGRSQRVFEHFYRRQIDGQTVH